MNLRSASSSLPKATAAAQVRSSRNAAAASLFALLLMLGIGTAHAAQMRFGPYTNAIGGNVLTNTYIKVQSVGDPAIDAAGNVTGVVGLPIRLLLGTDGTVTNTLQNQNYFVTNNPGDPAYFNKGYVFRAPLDSGPTVYSTTAPGILITGMNYFITLSGGTNSGSVTFNNVTNALGYTPLPPVSTNGYQRALQVTNITTAAIPTNFWSSSASLWISNLVVVGTLNTNRYAAGARLTSSTNSAGLVTFDAINQTNGYSPLTLTNVSQVLYTNALPSLTNGFVRSDITNNAATVQQLISATNGISGSVGISALVATNISTNQVFLGTNTIGIASGLSAFRSTNTFDVSGAANTSSNLVYGNAITQINTTSNSVIGTAQTIANTSSNLIYANANTAINTSSNLSFVIERTQINTSSNLVYGNALAQINTTSNTLNTSIAGKLSTNNGIAYNLVSSNMLFLGGSPRFDTQGSGEFQPNTIVGNILGSSPDGSGGLTLSQRGSGNWSMFDSIVLGTGGLTNRTDGDTAMRRSIIIGQHLYMDNTDTGANGDANWEANFAMGDYLRFYATNTATEQTFARTFMFGSNVNAVAQGGAAADSDSFLIGRNIIQRTNQIFQAYYLNGYDLLGGVISGNGMGLSGVPWALLTPGTATNDNVFAIRNTSNPTRNSYFDYRGFSVFATNNSGDGLASINPDFAQIYINNGGSAASRSPQLVVQGDNGKVIVRPSFGTSGTFTTTIDTNGINTGGNVSIGGATYANSAAFNGTLSITNGNYINLWFANGDYLRSNTIAPFDWWRHKTNGVIQSGTNNLSQFSFDTTTGISSTKGFAIVGASPAIGKTNMLFVTAPVGTVTTNDLTTFVASIIAGTSGGIPPITNAYGTNFPNGLLAGQRLYYPTNFDTLGGSNFLFGLQTTVSNQFQANKLDKTNGTSYGQVATNLATEGNLSFGFTGQATNIYSSTNILKFYNSGSREATNGTFVWNSTMGIYTNWFNSAIVTNNGSSWLLQTNTVTLYSISGANPTGAYSAINGALAAPVAVFSFYIDGNGFAFFGPVSITNFNTISNSIVTNIVTVISTTSNNFIANQNGKGTNTTLTFVNAAWGTSNATSGNWSAVLSGLFNSSAINSVVAGGVGNSAAGGAGGNFVGGGISNVIVAGSATISGGFKNFIDLNNNGSFIGSGTSNRIEGNTSQAAAILGGDFNTIHGTGIRSDYSVILGGLSNTVTNGNYSIAAGHNAMASKDNTFIWADGGATANTPTNAQHYISATNGLYVNGPIWIGSNNTNSGMYFKSNQFSLWAVTNSMQSGDFWRGNSNGMAVTIFYSNGVPFMRNDWP